MKRSAACLALVASLALAASASGGVYAGTGTKDPKVKVFFGVKKKQGKPRKVKEFTVVSVPFSCNGARGRTDPALPIEFPRPMKVNERRRFRGTETFTVETTRRDYRITMRVRGKVRRRGTAKGTVAIADPRKRNVACRSGRIPWAAVRVSRG